MCKSMRHFIVLVTIFISSNLHAQCAMCKAVIENDDVGMAEGVNSGITYLMIFPISWLFILFFIYHRKTQKLTFQ